MGKPGGGTDTKKRVTTISWIPFQEMDHMYRDLDKFIQKANENHFGFGDVRVTEKLSLQNIQKEDSMTGIWIVIQVHGS